MTQIIELMARSSKFSQYNKFTVFRFHEFFPVFLISVSEQNIQFRCIVMRVKMDYHFFFKCNF